MTQEDTARLRTLIARWKDLVDLARDAGRMDFVQDELNTIELEIEKLLRIQD